MMQQEAVLGYTNVLNVMQSAANTNLLIIILNVNSRCDTLHRRFHCLQRRRHVNTRTMQNISKFVH